MKNPDIWTTIWNWVHTTMNSTSFAGALSAFTVSVLRALYSNPEKELIRKLIDGSICGALALTTIPLAEKVVTKLSFVPDADGVGLFVGVMIGYIGTDETRRFVVNFLNKKTGG